MSKLELQQDHPVGTSTEPTNQPLPSGLKATSLTDNSARHEFAKDLNPFGDLRKKKKGEEFELKYLLHLQSPAHIHKHPYDSYFQA